MQATSYYSGEETSTGSVTHTDASDSTDVDGGSGFVTPIASAGAAAAVLAAGMGGVAYMKKPSVNVDEDLIEDVDVPESMLDREVMQEVDMDMFL